MLLEGKTGLVVGVANKRSLAWAVARAAAREGARLAVTYQNERLAAPVRRLLEPLEGALSLPLDVTDDEQIALAARRVGEEFGAIDFLVHGVAFAPREALDGRFLDTTREQFLNALDVSAYSLVALARALEDHLADDASIVTLTYLGSQRVVPHYNVMGCAKAALEAAVRYLAAELGPRGVRVNAISAGPVRTLAASGIPDFPKMLEVVEGRAPLRRNVHADDVGDAALFLLSRLSRGMTGEVLYVDAGYHTMGL